MSDETDAAHASEKPRVAGTLVALPLFFLLVWVGALVRGTEGSRDLGYALETGAFYYVVYVAWVLLGGLVHQVLLIALPRGWPTRQRRIVAIALTPVIPLVVILAGERVETVTSFWLPVVMSLVVYGTLVRLPEAPERAPA